MSMIKIIAVGKIKDKNLSVLIDDYLKKISRYHKISVIEVKDEAISANDSKEHIIAKEGERILKEIKDNDYVIALDLKGEEIDSLKLAGKLDSLFVSYPNIAFIIGGSLGIDENVLKRADYKLKLSKLTFLHQMTRLIILEQIYRSFKILNNETYHK